MDLVAALLYPSRCELGESPFWHAERHSCFWVDIEGCRIYECEWGSGKTRSWTLQHKVTLVVASADGNLVLGLKGGVAKFKFDTGDIQWLLDIEKEQELHRCNDGRCDSMGRLWIGTMHEEYETGAGKLYCLDRNLELHTKADGVTISNGLVWTQDNSKMYYVDSPTQTVQTFFFDQELGEIKFEKVAIHIPKSMGTPDGIALDEEGMLWIAHWGGFGVYRWDPETGKLLDRVVVPVPNVSSCAFAGDALDHLIITTARQQLSKEELERYPQSGDVFVVQMRVRGKADFPCQI
jgi:sugar lactone lactonase YvrE